MDLVGQRQGAVFVERPSSLDKCQLPGLGRAFDLLAHFHIFTSSIPYVAESLSEWE